MMSASPVGNFYIYSFDGKLLQLYNVYGTLLKDYIYMGDRLIAEYDHVGTRLLYYTPDQINTTRVITDQGGNVVYSVVHDPYGGIQQTGQNNTYDPQLKFSGKERDAESELDYFGARYYDRSQYRFISVDPIIEVKKSMGYGWNMYSFCGNRPISYLDPDGMSWLYYCHGAGEIYLILSSGVIVGPFPAANNGIIQDSPGGPWRANPFPGGDWPSSQPNRNHNWGQGMDSYGIFLFEVEDHSGMGVHAHNELFGASYTDATLGCISVESSTMGVFHWWDRIDPIEGIHVNRGAELELPNPVMTTDFLLASVQITCLVLTPLPAARDLSWLIKNGP
jgi:RHS repeat-associated protein